MRESAATLEPDETDDGVLEDKETIAQLLVEDGVITAEELEHSRRIMGKMGREDSVVAVLKKMGRVSDDAIHATVKNRKFTLPLGNLLLELGYISLSELRLALQIQRKENSGQSLGDILVKKRVIKEQDLTRVVASRFGMEFEEPDVTTCKEVWLNRLSAKACLKLGFFPVRGKGKAIVVAFTDPRGMEAQAAAQKALAAEIIPVLGTKTAIARAATALARRQAAHKAKPTRSIDTSTATGLIDSVFQAAVSEGVSDIHIEPLKERVRVRFRIDGVLREHAEFPHSLLPSVVTRIKVLAEANITEKRRHQDGRVLFEDSRTGATFDMRASFYVTVHGESVVLRVLNQANTVLDLKQLGMSRTMMERFQHQALDSPSGVIIVTGPTGSGKTTTLYSCVHYLNNETTSIITAEDPVEYVVDGISQCSLNTKLGLTFEESLRHMVRQDPDIIVLGEIRDAFSAESAIQAALTGHKVLTTFHTEDSIGGLLRLLNMNIEAFLISSTVVCVMAQRLIRRVCSECKITAPPDPRELQLIGWTRNEIGDTQFCTGPGCDACHFTGYRGRIAVFEILVLTEAVRDAILSRKTSAQIRRISVETSGLVTLLEDGLVKAARGDTTLAEVRRTLPRLSKPRPLNELKRLTGSHS